VYNDNERQVGHASTGSWSPTLKKYIALATVEQEFAKIGTRLEIEVTVNHKRKTAGVTVVKVPFYDPARKRALFQA
jgi:aminomethyltransferase